MSYSEYTEGIFDGDNLEYSDEIGGNIGIFENQIITIFLVRVLYAHICAIMKQLKIRI